MRIPQSGSKIYPYKNSFFTLGGMANKTFDFHEHAYDVMKQKWGSDRIPYHELYSYLGRRFCLRKQEVRRLLKGMEKKGYLEMKKNGVVLIEGS